MIQQPQFCVYVSEGMYTKGLEEMSAPACSLNPYLPQPRQERKQPKCPQVDESIKKMWLMCVM